MSEIPNMISALVDDNKIDAESHFKGAMAQKIGSSLDSSCLSNIGRLCIFIILSPGSKDE